MHIIRTAEESRWGKSNRRTVVVHIMSESSYGGYFLPVVMWGGGLNSVHRVTSSHAFIEALFFHRVCCFPLTRPSSPSGLLLLPRLSCHTFSPLLPLWLPPPPSVTPTFSCNFPWQHPPREEGDIVKVSRWYESGYVSDRQLNVLIPGLWWGVITSPLRVHITRHCYFTGYILPLPWEPDVEKVNGQLVLMQDYFLPAGCLCVGAAAEGRVQTQQGVSASCARIPSHCYIPWPLTHASESSLPTGSDQLLLLTGQSSGERCKTIKGNSTFQSGSSWNRPVLSLPWKTLLREPKIHCCSVHLWPWSVGGMWKTWCRSSGPPTSVLCYILL